MAYELGALGVGLLGVLALLIDFWRRERSRGRFISRPEPDIDDAWLEAEIFSLLPEEVGAAWCDEVSAMQALAVLSRLTQEGRLQTEIATTAGGLMSTGPARLQLQLLAPRTSFQEHERKLVDALFSDGEEETSSDAIARRYGMRRGKVVEAMGPALLARVASHPDLGDSIPAPRHWHTIPFTLAAAVVFVSDGHFRDLFQSVFFVTITSLGAYGVASSYLRVAFFDRWVDRIFLVAVALWPLGMGLATVLMSNGDAKYEPLVGPPLIGVALVSLAISRWLLDAACTRDGPRRLERRWALGRGQAWFQRQLRARNGVAPDRWVPYLLSYGLARDMRQPTLSRVGKVFTDAPAGPWTAAAARVLSHLLR